MTGHRVSFAIALSAAIVADSLATHYAWTVRMPAAQLVFWALAFSQVSLLGIWLGIGTSHGVLRAAGVAVGIAIWTRIIARSSPGLPENWTMMFVLQTAATALPLIIVQLAGVQLTAASAERDKPARPLAPPQFSLVQLLQWTTLVALLMAAVRFVGFPETGIPLLAVLAGGFSLLSLLAVAAMLRRAQPAWGLGWLCLATILVGCAQGLLLSWLRGDLYTHQRTRAMEYHTQLAVAQTLLVVAALWLVRWAGFRLTRLARVASADGHHT